MLFLNALRTTYVNMFGRVVTWRDQPASAIYSLGYGYDYEKTDD